ncbi:unnamed protein product [marine sediment metagenome]|uniref:Uncharacterized protein n=1 Tax=marine sediment metagenome TaxID=412755 RepID=X1HM81_9ZZZZ
MTMGGPQIRTWQGTVGPPGPPWCWLTNYPGELVIRVTFTPNPGNELADLFIEGFHPAPGNFFLLKIGWPIVWNTPTLYVINTWTDSSPALTAAEAIFTF